MGRTCQTLQFNQPLCARRRRSRLPVAPKKSGAHSQFVSEPSRPNFPKQAIYLKPVRGSDSIGRDPNNLEFPNAPNLPEAMSYQTDSEARASVNHCGSDVGATRTREPREISSSLSRTSTPWTLPLLASRNVSQSHWGSTQENAYSDS